MRPPAFAPRPSRDASSPSLTGKGPGVRLIITAVERSRRHRGRVDVYVDGAPACELSRSFAEARGLRPGAGITRDQLTAIVADDRRRMALDAAVAMLARRPRSEREVRQRLRRRKFEPELVEQTMARLRSAKLLDDAEYARVFTEARDRQSPRGSRLIARELRASGVDAAIADSAASAVSDDDAAYRLASRRRRSLAALDRDAFRNRLGGYLQRRGFDWDTCRATVERCWREREPAVDAPSQVAKNMIPAINVVDERGGRPRSRSIGGQDHL
jgi:regulatory protein